MRKVLGSAGGKAAPRELDLVLFTKGLRETVPVCLLGNRHIAVEVSFAVARRRVRANVPDVAIWEE
jgi:hypothetical protein